MTDLREAQREMVIAAGELRAVCAHLPGAGCPECADRRERAARLEALVALISPLARG